IPPSDVVAAARNFYRVELLRRAWGERLGDHARRTRPQVSPRLDDDGRTVATDRAAQGLHQSLAADNFQPVYPRSYSARHLAAWAGCATRRFKASVTCPAPIFSIEPSA